MWEWTTVDLYQRENETQTKISNDFSKEDDRHDYLNVKLKQITVELFWAKIQFEYILSTKYTTINPERTFNVYSQQTVLTLI